MSLNCIKFLILLPANLYKRFYTTAQTMQMLNYAPLKTKRVYYQRQSFYSLPFLNVLNSMVCPALAKYLQDSSNDLLNGTKRMLNFLISFWLFSGEAYRIPHTLIYQKAYSHESWKTFSAFYSLVCHIEMNNPCV